MSNIGTPLDIPWICTRLYWNSLAKRALYPNSHVKVWIFFFKCSSTFLHFFFFVKLNKLEFKILLHGHGMALTNLLTHVLEWTLIHTTLLRLFCCKKLCLGRHNFEGKIFFLHCQFTLWNPEFLRPHSSKQKTGQTRFKSWDNSSVTSTTRWKQDSECLCTFVALYKKGACEYACYARNFIVLIKMTNMKLWHRHESGYFTVFTAPRTGWAPISATWNHTHIWIRLINLDLNMFWYLLNEIQIGTRTRYLQTFYLRILFWLFCTLLWIRKFLDQCEICSNILNLWFSFSFVCVGGSGVSWDQPSLWMPLSKEKEMNLYRS